MCGVRVRINGVTRGRGLAFRVGARGALPWWWLPLGEWRRNCDLPWRASRRSACYDGCMLDPGDPGTRSQSAGKLMPRRYERWPPGASLRAMWRVRACCTNSRSVSRPRRSDRTPAPPYQSPSAPVVAAAAVRVGLEILSRSPGTHCSGSVADSGRLPLALGWRSAKRYVGQSDARDNDVTEPAQAPSLLGAHRRRSAVRTSPGARGGAGSARAPGCRG
jgi:hypothetical protein